MTAIAERRTRRTVVAAVAAGALTIVAVVLVAVGLTTLYNSRAGEAVGVDERPRIVLPPTPNALLGVTDEEGTLASVVVLTLAPGGVGGSIVTIPVNADSTTGFGPDRRPLNELFDPAVPDALVAAVEDMLSITIEQSAVVDPAGLEALLEPIGRVQVILPQEVVDSSVVDPAGDPDGGATGTVVATAGPQVLDTAALVGVLTAVDDGVPAYEQHAIDVAVWEGIAGTAPASSPVGPVTTEPDGAPAPPADVPALIASLLQDEVGVRDIYAFEPADAANPTNADVVILDRADAALVFAQISPGQVSPVNSGSTMRVVVPYTDDELDGYEDLFASNSALAREMTGRLLFLQANVVSVDTAPTGAPEITLVEVADPLLLAQTREASEVLFGPSEVRLAETVIEGVDIVVTLGRSFLAKELESDTGDAGLEPEESVPATTVGSDG